jgi:farnesyl-diphosphate farnesyltransferase
VLRDCPKDLRIGRCYLPLDWLQAHGLKPDHLLNPENSARARPLLFELLQIALGHFREAQRYLLAIPPTQGRLRLACLWPILIGLATIRLLAQNENWLDPAKPSKITRGEVKTMMLLSLPAVGSDTLVTMWIQKLIRDIEKIITRKDAKAPRTE